MSSVTQAGYYLVVLNRHQKLIPQTVSLLFYRRADLEGPTLDQERRRVTPMKTGADGLKEKGSEEREPPIEF